MIVLQKSIVTMTS